MHETTNSRSTIFLVEDDNNARAALTRSLREHGYRVLVSADLDDAFEWMSGNGYIHADLLLINLVNKVPEEALRIGRRLRTHCKYDGNTPIVIMPETVPVKLQGSDERITDLEWICHYEDIAQLKRLLAELLRKRVTNSNMTGP